MDFTLIVYCTLLKSLKNKGYNYLSFLKYLESENSSSLSHLSPSLILRHDVDRLPINALRMAKLENELGIEGTYYFRIVPESYDENIIRQIAKLGHEIGYHYEDVDLVYKNSYNLSAATEAKVDQSIIQPFYVYWYSVGIISKKLGETAEYCSSNDYLYARFSTFKV